MTAPAQAQDGRLPPRAQWQAVRAFPAPPGTDTVVSSVPRQSADPRLATGYHADGVTLSPSRILEARW
ncbi:hypothetical protein [Xanthomonas sacchari]|uniref:hypothetical protein n=1 Tax=Xanthomonas sacchari TaxID=56458 RepID=UPI0005821D0E|nr:hypothetical protein [Xanthomonas sacchari]AJC46370.1 hypothetical protein SB85_11980 [Xanthomonas sacchari]